MKKFFAFAIIASLVTAHYCSAQWYKDPAGAIRRESRRAERALQAPIKKAVVKPAVAQPIPAVKKGAIDVRPNRPVVCEGGDACTVIEPPVFKETGQTPPFVPTADPRKVRSSFTNGPRPGMYYRKK